LNTPDERATFVRQLYNFCHILERDEEAKDTYEEVIQLKKAIVEYDEEFPMKSFFFE